MVKTIGDAFLVTFRSPTDALLCSTAIHDRLAEFDAEADPTERFTLRAVVNVGEVRIDGGDVFGEAGAGEIYFSESAFLSMTRSEVPSEEVGYTEGSRASPAKIRLYRVSRANEAGFALQQHDEDRATQDSLPFAGLGLNPVRSKLAVSIPAEATVSHAQGVLNRSLETTLQGLSWWRTEVRRSRTVQYATAVLAIALIIFLAWAVNPKPKQLNPIQKIQRSFGF